MNLRIVEEIANAVLYEGYVLYPYRASAVKNRRRWNFGVVAPPGSDDPSSMQTECVVQGEPRAPLAVRVRFLQLVERSDGSDSQPWQEAVEREVHSDTELGSGSQWHAFQFPAGEDVDGRVVRLREAIDGEVEIETRQVRDHTYTVRVRIRNVSAGAKAERGETLLRSLISTNTILNTTGAAFVSLIDPPEEFRSIVANCANDRSWPVLVGEEGETDTMLSSPIILYDYPRIAPESPGALFDGTEIDEILTLRIMTMTDAEKSEMRELDDRTRQLLERTESLPPEHLMKLHGTLRGLKPAGGRAK
jgi:hypothetical protein